MTKFISIVSGKGGVGKTTTAINIGAALSSFGKEVLVVDGNVATPNIGLHLGTSRFACTIHDVLKGAKTLRDAVYIHSSGLKFVPGAIALEEAKRASIGQFEKIMLDLYGITDVVIIDGAAGIGSDAESVIKASDEVIVVTNPDIPSMTDALKIANVAREAGVNIYGIVVTRVNEKNDVSPKNISVILNAPLIAEVPEDDNVRKSLSIKQPLVFSYPDSKASVAYKKLAAGMLGQTYEEKIERKGFFSRLFCQSC